MNIKETFLKLTEYTTPFGDESELEEILLSLVPDLKKDVIGNYHAIIGNSETLFTCHLDNFCKKKEKVNHIIEGNIIKTDETTILGADNKAGVCVLLYLISNNVAGHYCFFIGEEPVKTDGCYGSYMFAKSFKSLSKYKRAIAFDRKENSFIVSRQMAQSCCSDEFIEELSNRFSENSIKLNSDPNSYYTDTSSFLEIIPECTNISVGVWNEHTKQEYVDIEFVEKIAIAASKIDWESLPYIREPKWWLENEIDKPNKEVIDYQDVRFWIAINSELSDMNFFCMNKNPYQPNKTMIFNNWFEEFRIEVEIKNGIVEINGYNVSVGLYDYVIFQPSLSQIIEYIKEDYILEITEEEEFEEIV